MVIAGEYNSGKSSLINAVLGERLLETGSLPTTDAITILSHADSDDDDDDTVNSGGRSKSDGRRPQSDGSVLHYRVQSPLLRDLTLVDTPGTNAVLTDHTAITFRLLPSADIILFVTSADRPFPESERTLLKSIASYRKSIVVIINKMDVLETTGGYFGEIEKQRVVDFVTEHASTLLGARPIVLAVSSRDALAAKLTGQASKQSKTWKRSNFAALEIFLRETLTTETKIKSKLSSPIGVVESVMQDCKEHLQNQQSNMKSDVATLNLLHSQFAAWKKELNHDMERAANDMQSVLSSEGDRAAIMLRRLSLVDHFRICLLDTAQLQHEWQSTRPITTKNTTAVHEELQCIVQDTASSIATHGRAQGQTIIEFLGQRPAMTNVTSLVGSVTAASRYEETRQSLQDSMNRAVSLHIWDKVKEVEQQTALLVSLKRMASLSAAMGTGALGSLAATCMQFFELLPGIASSSLLAIFSAATFSVVPHRLATQYKDAWNVQKERLHDDIHSVCSREVERVGRRIRDGVAPYTRFVESEQDRLLHLTDQCDDITAEAQRLRKRIANL
jgi:GTPase SAR1 family protein